MLQSTHFPAHEAHKGTLKHPLKSQSYIIRYAREINK